MYCGRTYGKLCMDPALLPDITTTYEHLQKSDGTFGMVEKANSGRMSPIRKRSVKDVEHQIESLEKENFDLKLRIYFLEQQKGINKDDTLKVNIDLRVQLQSIHQEFMKKQDTWERMMAGYENHIEELELQVNKNRSTELAQEVQGLKTKLVEAQDSLQDMEQLLNEKAFESESQLQAAHAELEKLKEHLADRERQLTTSPTQDESVSEELLAVKHRLDEKEAELEDKNLLLHTVNQQVHELDNQLKQVVGKLTETTQSLSERDAELNEKDTEIIARERQLQAVREELTQKDFSLRKAQIDLQGLHTSSTGKDADLERYKADIAKRFNDETGSIMADLENARRAISQRDAVLASRNQEIAAGNQVVADRDGEISGLNDELNKQRQKQALCERKFSKDLSNLQQQIHHLQAAVDSKHSEIMALRQRAEVDAAASNDSLSQLKAALVEKDRTIASLLDRLKQKEALLTQLEAAPSADEPDCTSTPRDSNPAISRLCMDIELLGKENAALREGRPMDYSDEDMDLDALSENSDVRDYLHTQLAKHNARAQSLQSKLMEMSREDVDGGSEKSSLLREQVSALMRMRESDKRVIDALKKHISVNNGSEVNPDVISNLAADVYRLSLKIQEMHKNGMRSNRSIGSRSQRSGSSSTTSSVYREEIDHLRKELDATRHEASKTRAELSKLSDESAVVGKLMSTEALVRQQAEEKKQLLQQIAYYRSLLEAAGLLPATPPVNRRASAGNLGFVPPSTTSAENADSRRTSRIPKRSSSTPRLISRESKSEERKRPRHSITADTARDGELQEHVQGVLFRQQNFTPDKIRGAMQKLGVSEAPVVNQSAPSTYSRIPTIDQSAMQTQTSPFAHKQPGQGAEEDLKALVDQYREEVQMFGRPVELKKQLDQLCNELESAQDKLQDSLVHNQQLEESYQHTIEEKDEQIEDLEERIRQLEAQLRAFYAGDMSGGGLPDHSGSVTLELAGSRPPSSLHSVPGERSSSRVVSLNGTTAHDRSTSGVVADRSTLSFSGSVPRPGSISPTDAVNITFGSLNKSMESGIGRPTSAVSSAYSHTVTTNSAATVVADDAGTRAVDYPAREDEISSIHAPAELMSKTLSPLHEVSSVPSRDSILSDLNRDSGLDTSHRSRKSDKYNHGSTSDTSRSVMSLTDTLDGTTERARRDDTSRYMEPPSLGGTALPGEALPTQENLLHVSSEAINTIPAGQYVRKLFGGSSTSSPEKGRLHSPTVSERGRSPAASERGRVLTPASTPPRHSFSSPVKAKETDETVERYEKKTSPNRQILSQPQANTWEDAANQAFGQQTSPHKLQSAGQLPDRPHSASVATSPLRGHGNRPLSASDVMAERPLSSSSTQTGTENFTTLGDRLVQALNREDSLKDQRKGLSELHKQYEEALRAAQDESEELRSRLSEAESEAESHLQKRFDTAEIANGLQQQGDSLEFPDDFTLVQKANALQVAQQTYENQLMSSEGRAAQLAKKLEKTKSDIGRLNEELSASQADLSQTREDLQTTNQALIESSRLYKDSAGQLRTLKAKAHDHEQLANDARSEAAVVREQLQNVHQELRSSQADLQQKTDSLRATEQLASKAKYDAAGADRMLERAENELRASQAELRMSKEELASKTNSQLEMTKRLRQLESERAELTDRLQDLQQQGGVLAGPSLQQSGPQSRPSLQHGGVQSGLSLQQGGLSPQRAGGDVLDTTPHRPRPQRSSSLPRSAAVRRLQEEITSLLDTSEHIKSNIASALEQSVLNDTQAEGGRVAGTNTAETDDRILELLRLNLIRVESLNERIAELLQVEQQALLAARDPPSSPSQPKGSPTKLLPITAEERHFNPSQDGPQEVQSATIPLYSSGKLNKSQNNAVDRSIGGTATSSDQDVPPSAAAAPELVTINGVTYQQVPRSQQQAPIAQGHRPTTGAVNYAPDHYQQPPATYDNYRQLDHSDHTSYGLSPEALQREPDSSDHVNYQSSPDHTLHQSGDSPQIRTDRVPASVNQWSSPSYFSQSDPMARQPNVHASPTYIADLPGTSQPPAHTTPSYGVNRPVAASQPLTSAAGPYTAEHPSSMSLPPAHTSPYAAGHPGAMTQPPAHTSLYTAGHPGAVTQPPVHTSPYTAGHPGAMTQPPAHTSPYTAGHPGAMTQPPAHTSPYTAEHPGSMSKAPAHTSYIAGHPSSLSQPPAHTPSYGHPSSMSQPPRTSSYGHPGTVTQSPAHTSSYGHPGTVTQPPAHTSTPTFDQPSDMKHSLQASRPYAASEGYHTGLLLDSAPLQQSQEPHRPSHALGYAYQPQPTVSDVYETIPSPERHLQEQQLANLPPTDSLPSTRGPLYAVSDLINYELLKKQNEESLELCSGLEARIQGRLDGFTAASPLDNSEWCTLKELRSCAENLRTTLFAEKKHITNFYIRELPDTKSQKYEEMLREYKKLQSKYEWAKAQLIELMKATKLDEDLVAQMKRVKSILRTSKENIKARKCTTERLRQRP